MTEQEIIDVVVRDIQRNGPIRKALRQAGVVYSGVMPRNGDSPSLMGDTGPEMTSLEREL